MITRVFKGSSPYGLVKYLYGQGRRNEHADPRMIASWDGNPEGLEPELLEEVGVRRVGPLVRQLEQPVRGCDRAPDKWVYHLVLRNAPDDRTLSDAEWAEVAAAAMDRTGIAPAGDPAGCRWIAVRHADDHVHVVATLAREDGRPPKTWGDFKALGEMAHEFEAKFGLTSTASRGENTAAARPGVKEQVTAQRLGRRESPRVVLRQKVRTAAAGSGGFADFTSQLAAQGVTVWPRMSEQDPEQITGYSVSLDDWANAAGEPVRFGGGKLAPDLSWPKLRARWAPDTAAPMPHRGARGAAPQRNQPPPRGPLTGEDADRVWREAERIVREAADRITADATGNPDAAADAAWAAADTLAGAAAGIEGDAGGPLTDAAEAFDRAGRDTYRRIPVHSDTGAALRSAGRMLALLTPGTRNTGAQVAAVTTALASLAAAVADLRQSQHRLHQSRAALATADQLRTIAPVPAVSVTTGPPRPRTAADIAGQSARPGGFRLRPTKPTAGSGTPNDPADQDRRGPDRGRGRGLAL